MSRTGAPQANASELAEIFRSLARQRRSGTLKVSDGAGRALYIYFREGEIQLVRSRRARTPIGRALVKRRKVTEAELERALKLHQQTGQKLGQCCLRLGYCDDDAIREALVFQAIEEVSDVFTWPQPKSEFHRGQPPLDIFDFQDLELRLGLSPEALVREARRRATELVELKRQLASFTDIYAPSPEALYAMRSPPEGSPDEELLRYLDGFRDVDEVLECVRLSELEAMRTLIRLIRAGEVVALTPHQLAQVAAECERVGKLQKAHRLYLRAEAAGLVQLDLPNRIAKLADRLGRREEAVARYLEFADRCRHEDLPEAAVAAYRKALELDPGSVQATEEIVAALLELGQPSQAVAMLKQVAQHCDPREDREKLQRCWQEVLRLMPEDLDAHRGLGDLFAEHGDSVQAIILLSELAAIHISRGEPDEAIAVLRRILRLDEGCVEAHLQLATTLAQTGRNHEAIVEYERLAESLSRQTGLRHSLNWQFLIDTYEKIVALDAGHVRARQWLAQAYQEKAESDKAVGNYAALVEALRRQPSQQPALADALKDYVALQPDDFLSREELGRVLASLDRKAEAVVVLAEARDRALRAQKIDAARRAAEQHCQLAPFDLGARRELARIALLEKDEDRAFLLYEELARLAELGGALSEAVDSARKALELRAEPDLRSVLARALELGGNPEEAAKEWVEAGRLESHRENYGRARQAAERAVELDPDLPAATDLLYLLESRRQGALSGGTSARWTERVAQKPSITGGSPDVTIVDRPQRSYGSIAGAASRLKALKGSSGRFEPITAASAAEPDLGVDEAAEAPAEGTADERKLTDGASSFQPVAGSNRAMSAMAKLKAMKQGGAPSPEAAASADTAPAPAAAAEPAAAGPERVADGARAFQPVTGGRALSAMAKLKAMKKGGAGAGGASGADPSDSGGFPAPAVPAAATSAAAASAGGAGPERIEDGARAFAPMAGSGQALSAMAKLKAMKKGGGGASAESGAAAIPSGAAAASASATDAAGADAAPAEASRVQDGARTFQPVAGSNKAMSAMARLKAMKGGPGGADAAAANPLAALAEATSAAPSDAAPEAERVQDGARSFQAVEGSGKARSAMAMLQAMKKGPAGAAAAAPMAVAAATVERQEPVADGAREYQPAAGSQKALSAAARLKALKGPAR